MDRDASRNSSITRAVVHEGQGANRWCANSVQIVYLLQLAVFGLACRRPAGTRTYRIT